MPQTSECVCRERVKNDVDARGAEGAGYVYRTIDKAVFSKNQDLPIKNKFLNSSGYVNIIGQSKFS